MALQSSEEYLVGIRKMGYPDYFPRIHGTLKLLAAIVILIPRKSIFKHWAYAGIFMTLLFAAAAHLSVDEPIIPHIVGAVLATISYYYYNAKMEFKSLPI